MIRGRKICLTIGKSHGCNATQMGKTVPKNKTEPHTRAHTRTRRYAARSNNVYCRIARIPNVRFTCFPAFRRLAAVAVSFSFLRFSFGRPKGKRERAWAVRLFKLQVPVEKCSLYHPRATVFVHT